MGKSVVLCYLLWLFGGVLGLHHFYLGRDRQAFVYWCLFGGYVFGWLRDFVRIPSYVNEANLDSDFMSDLARDMRRNKKPPWRLFRSFAQILVGNSFGYMFLAAIPTEEVLGLNMNYLIVFVPLVTALGVHTVGNIGTQQGKLLWPVAGAYLVLPFFYYENRIVGWSSILSTAFFNMFSLQWRKKVSQQKHICSRILTLSFCAMLWLSLWSSYFYFNLEITDKDGTKVKFRDAVGNFLKSPVFQDFKKSMIELWYYGQEHGWASIFRQLSDRLDPLGEQNALKVMGLGRGASQESIKAQWRHLSKRYHPDKFTSTAEKQKAQQKFIEIKDAYEKLADINARRTKQYKFDEDE